MDAVEATTMISNDVPIDRKHLHNGGGRDTLEGVSLAPGSSKAATCASGEFVRPPLSTRKSMVRCGPRQIREEFEGVALRFRNLWLCLTARTLPKSPTRAHKSQEHCPAKQCLLFGTRCLPIRLLGFHGEHLGRLIP